MNQISVPMEIIYQTFGRFYLENFSGINV